MAIPHARRKAAQDLGLVKVSPGYFTPQDAEMIEAARERANAAIDRHINTSSASLRVGDVFATVEPEVRDWVASQMHKISPTDLVRSLIVDAYLDEAENNNRSRPR